MASFLQLPVQSPKDIKSRCHLVYCHRVNHSSRSSLSIFFSASVLLSALRSFIVVLCLGSVPIVLSWIPLIAISSQLSTMHFSRHIKDLMKHFHLPRRRTTGVLKIVRIAMDSKLRSQLTSNRAIRRMCFTSMALPLCWMRFSTALSQRGFLFFSLTKGPG